MDLRPLNSQEPRATDDLEEGCLVDLENLNRSLTLIKPACCGALGRTARGSGERVPIDVGVMQQQGGTE